MAISPSNLYASLLLLTDQNPTCVSHVQPASDGSKRSTAASPKGRKRRHSGKWFEVDAVLRVACGSVTWPCSSTSKSVHHSVMCLLTESALPA